MSVRSWPKLHAYLPCNLHASSLPSLTLSPASPCDIHLHRLLLSAPLLGLLAVV